MQHSMLLASLLTAAAVVCGESANPIQKVIEMLSGLEAKIIGEGEESQKLYDEFSEWCEDTARQLGFEIKTGKAQVADLKATIEEETATISGCASKADDLSADISTDEADLTSATQSRTKEAADFSA